MRSTDERWAGRDAEGSVNRPGFARRTVILGMRGKGPHRRSRDADRSVNIARVGCGGHIGVVREVTWAARAIVGVASAAAAISAAESNFAALIKFLHRI